MERWCWILLLYGCFSEATPVSTETDEGSGDTSTEATSQGETATADAGMSTTSAVSTAMSSNSASTADASSSESGAPALGALFFDGDDEATSVPVPEATLPPDFTVELWVEVGDEPYFGVLIDTRDDPPNGWIFLVQPTFASDGGRLILNWVAEDGVGGHGFTGPDVSGLDPGWHHWAFTRDADGLTQCWIDGALGGQSAFEEPPLAGQTSPVSLGRHLTDPARGDYWWRGGALDEVHVSNVARYTADFVPGDLQADENSVLLWRLDEGSGDTVIDEVSGVELALNGPTWVEGR